MSADNAVFVVQSDEGWHVAEWSMSTIDEYFGEKPAAFPIEGRCQVFGKSQVYPDRGAALIAAHDAVNEMAVCEYGVVELSSVATRDPEFSI